MQAEKTNNNQGFLPGDVPTDEETPLFFSKRKASVMIMISMIFLACGIFCAWNLEWQALFYFGLFTILSIGNFQMLFSSTPQIVLSKKGIKVINEPIQAWSDIKNERFEGDFSKKTPHVYLIFEYRDKQKRYDVVMLNLRPDKIKELLQYYRKEAANGV